MCETETLSPADRTRERFPRSNLTERWNPPPVPHRLGFLPEELDYVFEPPATPDPMERAQILASYAGTVVQLLEAGILTREEAEKEMREMR